MSGTNVTSNLLLTFLYLSFIYTDSNSNQSDYLIISLIFSFLVLRKINVARRERLYAMRSATRRLNDIRNLYGRKGTPPRSLSCSPAFAFFIDLSLPYGLCSQSSAEIANGVTRGGKREMRGPQFPVSLGATSSVSCYRYSTRLKSIVGSLRSPVTVARTFYFAQDIDFRISSTDTCNVFHQSLKYVRKIYKGNSHKVQFITHNLSRLFCKE